MESTLTPSRYVGIGLYTFPEAARIIGIKPAKLRRWALASRKYAATPATSITVTSNGVLLIANDPTTQKSMITGMSTERGTFRICFDTLMHHQPSGIMIRLAMMNSRYTA